MSAPVFCLFCGKEVGRKQTLDPNGSEKIMSACKYVKEYTKKHKFRVDRLRNQLTKPGKCRNIFEAQ